MHILSHFKITSAFNSKSRVQRSPIFTETQSCEEKWGCLRATRLHPYNKVIYFPSKREQTRKTSLLQGTPAAPRVAPTCTWSQRVCSHSPWSCTEPRLSREHTSRVGGTDGPRSAHLHPGDRTKSPCSNKCHGSPRREAFHRNAVSTGGKVAAGFPKAEDGLGKIWWE